MTRHHARALAAALVLLVTLVGLPLALAATIGNPTHGYHDLRSGGLSDEALLAVLATVAWLAWASFAAAFVIEVGDHALAALTHRPARARRVPLLGTQQLLVRALLGATLLTAAPAPVHHPQLGLASACLTTAVSTPSVAAPPVPPEHPATPHQATYTIPAAGGLRTFWDLAQHYLGDGQHWPQLWALNEGRVQPDGTTMTNPQLLRPGWTVLVPAAASATEPGATVTVHEGDTLAAITAAHGLTDWTSTWQLNRDRTEPGGQRFTDPDLIRTGWTLDLPTPATPTATVTTPRRVSPPPAPAAPSTVTPRASAAPVHTPSPAPSRSEPTHTDTSPTPRRSSAPHATAEHGHEDLYLGGGVLLAGVVLAELTRRRRRQQRHRRPGRIVPRTAAAFVSAEKRLQETGVDAAADVAWLDTALRQLAITVRDDAAARGLPDVIAARLGNDTIDLVFTGPQPHPPAPWVASEDATRWTLSRTDHVDEVGIRAEVMAPYPTLASIGRTADGDTWLLDLERIAAVSVDGDLERAVNFARFLAAELAHNTWSDQLAVTCVGFGAELTALNPHRLSHAHDLSAVTGQLTRQIEQTEHGPLRLPEQRLHHTDYDQWTPHVLLVAPRPDDPSELRPLLDRMRVSTGRTGIAVVIATDDPDPTAARWQVHIDADGTLHVPQLHLDLIAHQLTTDEAVELAQLLAAAATEEDEPMPDAHGDQPWDELSDAAGAPRGDLTAPRADRAPHPPLHTAITADAGLRSVLPQPAASYLDTAATTTEDLDALAPTIAEQERRKIEDADPTLDADLASWLAPTPDRPRLSLLGKPTVTGARGSLPEGRPREDFYTEVVALLATRATTTVAQVATAFWPHDPGMLTKTTPRQAVMLARKWLGTDPSGAEHIPHASDGAQTGAYRVHDVLVDAELFRRLRLRGIARGGQTGITDLQTALALVRGIPFDRRELRSKRGNGAKIVEPYSWLIDNPLDREYTAMIVDTAHTVATHYLAAGEPTKAQQAAEIALACGDCSDIPLLDLLAAFDAQGHTAQAEECVRKILANNDAEIEEDLPTRTYQVLLRRGLADAS